MMKNPMVSAVVSFGIALIVLWRGWSLYTELGVNEATGVGLASLGRISRAVYDIGGRNAVLGMSVLLAVILVATGVHYLRTPREQQQ